MQRAAWIDRIIIFFSGFIPRLFLGFVFYGCIDVNAYCVLTDAFLNNTLVTRSYINTGSVSFPVIPFFLWFASWISWMTGLPPVFCIKILPIIFDALIALVVYEFVKRLRPTMAFSSGLLYALSPIALFTTSIHGQWESLPIYFFLVCVFVRDYFKDSYTKYFFFGALFVAAFLMKPMPLIFIPFFFIPSREARLVMGTWLYRLMIVVSGVMVAMYAVFKLQKTLTVQQVLQVVGAYLVSHVLAVCLIVAAVLLGAWMAYHKLWRSWSASLRQYCLYQVVGVIGLIVVFGVCLALFVRYGLSFGMMFDNLLRYFNQGIQDFGLPFAYPFCTYPMVLFFKNRFWLMAVIVGIAWLYYRGRINLINALIVAMSFVLGLSGVLPHYFVWMVPFLLIGGWRRIAAVYNIMVTALFFLYYMSPFINPNEHYQSMASFAARKSFAWFMPPAWWSQPVMTDLMHVFGNYCVPTLCIVIGIYVLKTSLKNSVIPFVPKEDFVWYRSCYVVFGIVLVAIVTLLMHYSDFHVMARYFDAARISQRALYAVSTINGFVVGVFDQSTPLNAINVLAILALAWSGYAFFYAEKRKNV